MGAVYRGVAPDGRPVAVKVIRRELAADAGFRARFTDEVTNARRVASFCTARVLDHGEADGAPYLVTEYIEGPSLSDHVDEHGPLPAEPLRALAVGIATALVAIHGVRLVHRDLKPSNVLLSADGPRVIDFGVARALDSSERHTQTGFVVGSPGWIAPEQLFDGRVDTAVDVFTWGSLIAYAATGRHPYGSGNMMVLATKAYQGSHDLTGVPDALRPLITAALDPDPSRRPSAENLVVALVGDADDPQTGARRLVTQAWTPAALPPAMFAPPAPTPPSFPTPAPAPAPYMAPYMAPPQMPQMPMAAHSTPPPFTPPPMPARGSAGPAVALIAIGLLVVLVVGVAAYVLQQGPDGSGPGASGGTTGSGRTADPGSSGGTGRTAGGNEVTTLPDLCRALTKVLPAKARGAPFDPAKNTSPDLRFCNWERRNNVGALDLSVDAQIFQTLGDRTGTQRAREEMDGNYENVGDPTYHRSRERLSGLGDEAIASEQFSPITAGPSEDDLRSYWMGGARLYVRRANVVIDVKWTAADYPPSVRGGRTLKGRNLPYAQARREAIELAKAALAQIG
ncbi:serine/threonine protein kinase [Thermomonospora umbrina]|uniref:Serine/threonine protein kinase n=2 Tax=Thermomonospora umbrina TaxID=111806 RepID=A0A3D9SY71_9ACTN|nr:serine/threonine protein kinase [Thermomonospora umbrina]